MKNRKEELYKICFGDYYKNATNMLIYTILDMYMSELNKLIITMYYIKGYSHLYIAGSFDMTLNEVRNRIKDSISILESSETVKYLKEGYSLSKVKEFQRNRNRALSLYNEIKNDRVLLNLLKDYEVENEALENCIIEPCNQNFARLLEMAEMDYMNARLSCFAIKDNIKRRLLLFLSIMKQYNLQK